MPPTSAPALDRSADPELPPVPEPVPVDRVNRITSIPFWLLHLLPLLAIFTGVSVRAVVLCVVLYYGRMFFITAGYHRYFGHRSYRLNRFWQFVMAFGGTTAAQKGPLWWAAHHRDHHRYSDSELDVHSPTQRGFFWSHVGWILCDKYAATEYDRIRDFAKYPELVFLNKKDWIGPWALGIASYLIAGWSGLLIGFFLSTVLLWHATFTVNSLAHVMGRRRYATEDTSRNSALIAVLTMGEGWHNNHHYYQSSARQGFFWWEWDPSYYILVMLSWLGLVKDLKKPPVRVKAAARIRDGSFDMGMFKAHWAKAGQALHNVRSHLPSRDTGAPEPDLDPEVAGRREQLEELIRANRAALQQHVQSTLDSAEELARLSRRHDRQVGVAD